MLEESIREVCRSNISGKYLAIADLGCASGPNALAALQSIINVVVSSARFSGSLIPELNVFLNDLPHNDFNSTFKTLSSSHREIELQIGLGVACYISGTPGSFSHAFYALFYLSTLALSDDLAMFLRCRSIEIVHGGRIVDEHSLACPLMELASIALYKLASQGRIDKEKLDRLNLQYCRPTIDQVKQLIESEGSLALDKLDIFTLSWVETMRAEQIKNETHKVDVHQSSIETA